MLIKPEGKLNIVSSSGVPIENTSISANTVIKIDHTKKEFEERYDFNAPRPVGPQVLIEVYKHEMSEVIEITEQSRDRQKWESNVGRVCKIGGACYKGERFKYWPQEELPKVGDWITYKVNAGTIFKYGPPGKGVDVMIIYDDYILSVIENPAYVVRS
jgi:hypothetical protein